MSEMIDKVAAAIATFSTGSADNYKNYRDEARAAIEAMMEATDAMVEAGQETGPIGCCNPIPSDIQEIWQAILSTALHGDQEG